MANNLVNNLSYVFVRICMYGGSDMTDDDDDLLIVLVTVAVSPSPTYENGSWNMNLRSS